MRRKRHSLFEVCDALMETPCSTWENGVLRWNVSPICVLFMPPMLVKAIVEALDGTLAKVEWHFRPRIEEE